MDVYVCVDARRLSKHKLSNDRANHPEGQLRAAVGVSSKSQCPPGVIIHVLILLQVDSLECLG